MAIMTKSLESTSPSLKSCFLPSAFLNNVGEFDGLIVLPQNLTVELLNTNVRMGVKSVLGAFLVWVIPILIAIILIILLPIMLYVVKQWQTATVIRFGKIVKTAHGGMHIKMPFIDSLIKLYMRVQTFDLRARAL